MPRRPLPEGQEKKTVMVTVRVTPSFSAELKKAFSNGEELASKVRSFLEAQVQSRNNSN